MNVWNKVLYVLTALMCVAFTIFAANKYQLTKTNDEKIAQLKKQIADAEDAVAKLQHEIYGDPEKKIESWRDCGLDTQLARIRSLQDGESFANCQPIEARVDEDALTSTVSFGVPSSYHMSSFRTGAVVFLFDSGKKFVADKSAASEDGEAVAATDVVEEAAEDAAADATAVAASAPYSFLGAFKVVGVANAQVNLESIGNSSVAELTALSASAKSGNSWVVSVDRLPVDSPVDVAFWMEESPEMFSGLSAEQSAFFAKGGIEYAETLEASATTRFPVDYQEKLENQWTIRDAENVLMARNTNALNDLTAVVADQFVSVGEEVTNETALAFKDWDAAYAAAQGRKKVDSYTERIAATEAQRDKMIGYRDLVKSVLDDAQDGVAQCEQAIEATAAENAKLAAEIARIQYALMEKLEQAQATYALSL